jgi:predicted aldo/keto reductase-like oxidoreductase
MKGLGGGSLLKAESSPFGKEMTAAQCCQYCLTRPGVTSVLVGCHTAEELKTALTYCNASEEEKDYSFIFAENSNIRITGKCMYCNHCQPCPAQLDIGAITKFLDLALMQDEMPSTIREHYFALARTADDCLMCGSCEENCPFSVNVRGNMEKARSIFYKQ